MQKKPLVAVIMGSSNDWDTMKEACIVLDQFSVSYTKEVVSAHRTPEYMQEFSKSALHKGYQVIIAGAGGAAHLPGMVASYTTLPVLGVPIPSKHLQGLDSLYSIVQMPRGVPVGTLAIGTAGAANAALLAIRILSLQNNSLRLALEEYRHQQAKDAKDSNQNLI